uniref:Uncharacterized protein n=1 Tax=Daphnia galeata TaxID=27404 RepID=A0A8J2WNG8_9CRUS|nr:unnamed protein product [Daphnia galeata]
MELSSIEVQQTAPYMITAILVLLLFLMLLILLQSLLHYLKGNGNGIEGLPTIPIGINIVCKEIYRKLVCPRSIHTTTDHQQISIM